MRNDFTSLALSIGMLATSSVAAFGQTHASAHTYGMRYDNMGREVGTIAPDPDGAGGLRFKAKRITYGVHGLPTKIETGELSGWQSEAVDPASWSGFTSLSSVEIGYNNNRRKVLERIKGNNNFVVSVKQFSYDAWGRLDCIAERMNPVAFGILPANACEMGPVASNGAEDRILKHHYDAAGQLIRVERAVGTSLVQNYSTFSYTGNGKPKTITDANGNQATYVYDGFDRQVAWRFPSASNGAISASCNLGTIAERGGNSGQEDARGAGDDCEKYSYDRNGNRTRLVKRDGTVIAYAYDALNRMTIKDIDATGLRADLAPTHKRDVYYGYDLRGLQIYARFDSNAATSEGLSFAYDGFGQLIRSTQTLDQTTRTLTYTWDKNGNRTQIKHPDNQTFNYQYDGMNRMKGLLQASVSLGTMTYNNRGLLATLGGAVATSYRYDNVGRLSSLSHNLGGTATSHDVTFTLGYNPASQITRRYTDNDAYVFTGDVNSSRAYVVNGLNQYLAAGTSNFSYDANGNLIGAGNIGYVYDVENRLVGAFGGTTVNLRYDPLGRLYETSGGYLGLTRFLYDGDELVGEYGPTGSMLRRYVHGRGEDDPMIWYEGAGVEATAIRRLRTNHQGSVVAIANNAGAPLAVNAYDDWGLPNGWMTPSAADDNVGRFQYTGQAWIPELGMYHYKARFYSVTLGRFMQTDPIGYKDQMNLYAYVGNDPVNKVDPTGRNTVAGAAVGCAVSGPACPAGAAVGAAVGTIVLVGAGVCVAWCEDAGRAFGDIWNGVFKNETSQQGPSLPKGLVGAPPHKEGKGGQTQSGPLHPDHGGTGDPDMDFGRLTGGTGKLNETGGRPVGTQVGDNGIQIRPGTNGQGPRIDVPPNGLKPGETLHYPPPNSPPIPRRPDGIF